MPSGLTSLMPSTEGKRGYEPELREQVDSIVRLAHICVDNMQ
jgi:hypothetical protein